MWSIVQSLINGVLSGGVYALIAVGITIIFGVMRLINFASGAFLVIGMYLGWLAYSITGWNYYELIPFVAFGSAILGYLSFRLTMIPILNKSRDAGLLVTVGLAFLLQNLVLIVFGNNPLTLPSALSDASIQIGKYFIGLPRVIAFGTALILVVLVTALVNKTRFGKAMRATSENTEIAEMLGIKTNTIFALAWTLGIVLMGIGGLMITPLYFVQSSLGSTFRTTPIIAVVLGGLGSIKGAFISGILLGVVESLVATNIASDLGPLGIFVLYLVMFYILPRGLFGERERVA